MDDNSKWLPLTKVIHLIDSLSGAGGAEQGLVREVTRFSDDLDQRVIHLFESNSLAPALAEADVAHRWLGLVRHSAVSAYPIGIRRLVPIIRAEKPDVIQTSLVRGQHWSGRSPDASRARRCYPPSRSRGQKSLLQAHQPGAASRKAEILRRIGARAARGRTVYFRSLTADAADTNAQLLGIARDRVTVIPRGVPTDLRPEPLRTRTDSGCLTLIIHGTSGWLVSMDGWVVVWRWLADRGVSRVWWCRGAGSGGVGAWLFHGRRSGLERGAGQVRAATCR